MLSKWVYILLGNDRTGKTTFQKEVIRNLTSQKYDRLDCNKEFGINTQIGKTQNSEIFIMNRSFQEKRDVYLNVNHYFVNFFLNKPICILSSHLDINDISEMIMQSKKRFYNVCGVFFSNSIDNNPNENADIACLDWDEKYYIENPISETKWEFYLERNAFDFSGSIIRK
jgi:hypothetical protein